MLHVNCVHRKHELDNKQLRKIYAAYPEAVVCDFVDNIYAGNDAYGTVHLPLGLTVVVGCLLGFMLVVLVIIHKSLQKLFNYLLIVKKRVHCIKIVLLPLEFVLLVLSEAGPVEKKILLKRKTYPTIACTRRCRECLYNFEHRKIECLTLVIRIVYIVTCFVAALIAVPYLIDITETHKKIPVSVASHNVRYSVDLVARRMPLYA